MINDSGIEIDARFMQTFLSDSFQVLSELKIIVNSFQMKSELEVFEKYATKVEKIMQSSFTLSLNELGELAKLGKEVSLKSVHLSEFSQIVTAQSLISQLTRSLEVILLDFSRGKRPDFDQYKPLQMRLHKASQQLNRLPAPPASNG
jgi:hypothetical protein